MIYHKDICEKAQYDGEFLFRAKGVSEVDTDKSTSMWSSRMG